MTQISRRIISIWLPHWPMERFARKAGLAAELDADAGHACLRVMTLQAAHGPVIHDCNAAACAEGLYVGQRLVDARALCPQVLAHDGDLKAELADLKRLATWCRRWSPWVSVDMIASQDSAVGTRENPDGLIMDASGCAHLFGGERAMLDEIEARLGALGLSVRAAIAPTRGAAWALARFGPEARSKLQAKVAPQIRPASKATVTSQATGGARAADTLVSDAAPDTAPDTTPDITPGTAPKDVRIVPDGGIVRALSPLPVAALRIDAAAILLLRRVGLKTIGQLIEVPRAALSQRFHLAQRNAAKAGASTLHPLTRLDQVLGLKADPLSPLPYRPRARAVQSFMEPLVHVEAVRAALTPLIERICVLLEEAGQGTRAIKVEGFRSDGQRATLHAATSRPTRTASHLVGLLKDKLEDMDAGFGFDAVSVEAVRAQALDMAPADLTGAANVEGDSAALIDRLVAKLGAGHVLRPQLVSTYLPERSVRWTSALDYGPPKRRKPPTKASAIKGPGSGHTRISADMHTATDKSGSEHVPSSIRVTGARHILASARPHRLLEPPEEIAVTYGVPEDPPRAFTWRRRTRRITHTQGPERIAPEWWRADIPGLPSGYDIVRTRDYYRIEDEDGRRYWVFRAGRVGDQEDGDLEYGDIAAFTAQPPEDLAPLPGLGGPAHASRNPGPTLQLVTADVTGNATGDVVGDVTGEIIGTHDPPHARIPDLAMPRWYLHGLFG